MLANCRWTGADNLTRDLTKGGKEALRPDDRATGRDPPDTKLRLFRLVVLDHYSVPAAAAKIGIRRQTAWPHVNEMERRGIMKRIPDTNPVAFEKGTRATAWLEERERQGHDGIGASAASAPRLSANFHRELWGWEITDGPRRKVPWTSESFPKGVANYRIEFVWEGEQYLVWEARGKRSARLMVWLPEYVAFADEDLQAVARQRQTKAAKVLRAFAERFRYRFHGHIEQLHAPEHAVKIPGMTMPAAGTPGGAKPWWDHSHNNREGEWESKDLGDVERMLTVPKWMPKVEKELIAGAEKRDEHDERLRSTDDHLSKIDEVLLRLERADERHDKVEQAIVKVVDRLVPVEQFLSPPPDERRDVA